MPRQGVTPNKIPRTPSRPSAASSAAASEPRDVGDRYLDPRFEGFVPARERSKSRDSPSLVPARERSKSRDSTSHSPTTPTSPTDESEFLDVRPARTFLPEDEQDLQWVYAVDGGTCPFPPAPGEYETPEYRRQYNMQQSQAAPSTASSSSAALTYPTSASRNRATSAPGAVGSEVSTRAGTSDRMDTETPRRFADTWAEVRRQQAYIDMIKRMPKGMRFGHEQRDLAEMRQEEEGAESTTTHTDSTLRTQEQSLGGRPHCMRSRKWQANHDARAARHNNLPGQLPKEERVKAGIMKAMIKRANFTAAMRCGMTVEAYTKLNGALSPEDAAAQAQLSEDILRVLGVTAAKTIKLHDPDHPWGFRFHWVLVAR